MTKTFIHYRELPDTSLTKKGWLIGKKDDISDTIGVQIENSEFHIEWDKDIKAAKVEIWSDAFQHLDDPFFARLAMVKNPTMYEIVMMLEANGYVCKNNETR